MEKSPLINEKMSDLCDVATEAHAQIQKNHKDVNPVMGVILKMREAGFPADALTIDCLKSGKRIILVLHDARPDSIQYQFFFKDQDPGEKFEEIAIVEITTQKIYDWVEGYFVNNIKAES